MDISKIKDNIKKFFLNKNTATFFLVIVLVVVVYVVYLEMINTAVDLKTVPYSNSTLKANTVISTNDYKTIKISGNVLTSISGSNIITSPNKIIGYQVQSGYQIPKLSFFYKDAVTEKNLKATDDFSGLPDGHTIYALDVDFHKTFGNSIMPGNYIDLYFKTTDNGKLIFEKFISSIQVYKVADSSHQDVFSNADDESESKPKYLYFSVKDDIYKLLMICEKIGGIEIIPVQRNASYSASPGNTEISNKAIEEYIRLREYEIKN